MEHAPLLVFGSLFDDGGAVQFGIDVGSLEFNVQPMALLLGRKLTIEYGALDLAGQDVTLSPPAGPGTASVGGVAPLLVLSSLFERDAGDKLMTTSMGWLNLAGMDVALRKGRAFALDAGTINLAGADAEIDFDVALNAGVLDLSGQAVTYNKNMPLSLGYGAISLAGMSATLRKESSGARNLLLDAAILDLAGLPTSLQLGRVLSTEVADIDLAGQNVSFISARSVPMGAGVLNLAGQSLALSAPADPYVLLALRTVNGALPSPSQFSFAFWDTDEPVPNSAPVQVGTGQINGAGQALIHLPASALVTGEVGYIIITNTSGDPDVNWKQHSGPVRVM